MRSMNGCTRSTVTGLAAALVLVVAATGAAWGLSPRTAVATPAAKPPVIDGKLDDDCWKSAGVLTDFLADDGSGIAPDTTIVRTCYDKDFLYVGVTCMESDWNTARMNITERDERNGKLDLYQDDDLEIFFDPAGEHKTYYQFLTNGAGIRAENLGGNVDWDCDWKVKTSKSTDRWTAEMAFPLTALGKATDGSSWGFNIGRGQPGKNVSASFAGILGKWSSPGNFATLRFARQAAGEGRIFPERKGSRVYALHPEKPLELTALPAPGDEYLHAFATPGEVAPYTFRVVNLEEKGILQVQIAGSDFRSATGVIPVPGESFLYLLPKMTGGYEWEFLGSGQEITVRPGQCGGFWLDLAVPENAPAGIYQGAVTLKLTHDGASRTEKRDLKLMVLPFKLDANPITCGFHYTREPLTQMRESFKLMHDNGMTTVAPIYGGWGVNEMETYVDLHQETGFTGSLIYASTEYIGDNLANAMRTLPHRGPKLRDTYRTWEVTPEYAERYCAEMKMYLDEAKRLGHPEMAFSLGDELTVDGRWGAQHLIDRAEALRKGLPDIVTTTDASGVFEAVGASKWLTRVGVNDGWGGPDNYNGSQRIITPAVLDRIKANGCKPEFVNTGCGRFPYGFYLWRMHQYGVFSKIEWIWNSDRMDPSWTNVYRENGKTFVTVSLKHDRSGTYDVRYATTLEGLLAKHPDAEARQYLDDVTAQIPVDLREANGSGWSVDRADAVRWTLARQIMRLTGKSVGVPAPKTTGTDALTLDPASSWSTADLTKQYIRHSQRTFAVPLVANAPPPDGRLDDPVWQRARIITGAYDDTDLSLAEGMMTVRALRTDQGVYLGIASREPEIVKLSTGKAGRDDANLWQADDIEIFIDPDHKGDYYHLVYDSAGAQTDYKNKDISWNGSWKVGNVLGKDTWTSVVFLPFADFGGPDKPWGIEIGRGSPTRGVSFGIMPIQGSWHDTPQFGTFQFTKLEPYMTDVNFGRLQVGTDTLTLSVVNPTDNPLQAFVSFPDTVQGVLVEVKPHSSTPLTCPFKVTKSGEQPMTLTLADPGDHVLDRESFIAQVPELLSLTVDPASLFSSAAKRAANVGVNLPADKLGDYKLQLQVIGKGVNATQTVDKLVGNRFACVLNAPGLGEGKYELKVRLMKGNAVTAEKSAVFFVTTPPAYD